jgi:hypothetical protein
MPTQRQFRDYSEGLTMNDRPPAAHRIIFLLDIEGFASPQRTNKDQVAVREGLKHVWQQAIRRAGIDPAKCEVEDLGDGIRLLAPGEIPKAPFIDAIPFHLAATVRDHNATHPAGQQIRLRMALHAGEVELVGDSATGAAIVHAFRLIDAPELKQTLAKSSGVIAVITSDWFYHEVVKQSDIVDPAAFRQVRVSVKETNTTAWIGLPDHITALRRLVPWSIAPFDTIPWSALEGPQPLIVPNHYQE